MKQYIGILLMLNVIVFGGFTNGLFAAESSMARRRLAASEKEEKTSEKKRDQLAEALGMAALLEHHHLSASSSAATIDNVGDEYRDSAIISGGLGAPTLSLLSVRVAGTLCVSNAPCACYVCPSALCCLAVGCSVANACKDAQRARELYAYARAPEMTEDRLPVLNYDAACAACKQSDDCTISGCVTGALCCFGMANFYTKAPQVALTLLPDCEIVRTLAEVLSGGCCLSITKEPLAKLLGRD